MEVNLVKDKDHLLKKTEVEEENKVQNVTLTTELHFELMKQYAWLSSAFIGAVIVLIQLKFISFEPKIFIVLGCFGFSILNCLFSQDFIVESLTSGKSIYDIANKVRIFRHLAVAGLGVGSGLLVMLIYKAQNLAG